MGCSVHTHIDRTGEWREKRVPTLKSSESKDRVSGTVYLP